MKSLLTDEEQMHETKHLSTIVRAFYFYTQDACERVLSRLKRDYDSLSVKHRDLLGDQWPKRISAIALGVQRNQLLLNAMAELAQIPDLGLDLGQPRPSLHEMENVRSVLRQWVRDWSEEGAKERESVYGPLLKELERRFPNVDSRFKIHVLVPGVGLGRLAYEIARLGFTCQGNDFSYNMLLGSELALNCMNEKGQFRIHPYVLQGSNVWHVADQLRGIDIPDHVPENCMASDSSKLLQMSIVAGDFLQVYNQKTQHNQWDVVITCFFLDTANNVLDYLDCIWSLLKPGGSWLNCGPLLYHHEENDHEMSLSLSQQELLYIIDKMGFVIEHQSNLECTYAGNVRSLLRFVYQCLSFYAFKPFH